MNAPCSGAPLTAPHVTTGGLCRWKAINKEGRHVGLDFYDLLIEGHSAQNADQAAPSLRNRAKERIDFILSSGKPRRSSSPRRFSYKSLPNTSVSREPRKSYLRSISLRRSVR